ncbi:Transmembrane protein 164 [Papilio machaon]|uniref:Transmembrane protein 164 n=1 Tax=Papilio machaon TaxID=76193 RepID=A0A194RCE0_PAPMA|nr:transmembrane protein 164 [Papilio machaon]KPJ15134.1 Transmembrane protein 164 [Papilio machaon]
MFEWAYSGANKAVPRNVGPECAYFLSTKRQIIETVLVTSLCIYTLLKIYPKLQITEKKCYSKYDRGGKRLLVILLSLLWGMEIGFKFASRTVIYLLNPCHVTTLMQIYLLTAPPSNTVTTIFRIHLNLLNGPLLAFIFPETASRTIFAEAALYWIQHGMMFVIPYYLLRIGGVYNVEPFWDFNWCIFSYALNLLYHFIVLQLIAIPAQVNLNHMLCPAILDPFDGPWYRTAAVIHQALLCPLLCKLFCLFADFCLTKFPPTKVKPQMCDLLQGKDIVVGDHKSID